MVQMESSSHFHLRSHISVPPSLSLSIVLILSRPLFFLRIKSQGSGPSTKPSPIGINSGAILRRSPSQANGLVRGGESKNFTPNYYLFSSQDRGLTPCLVCPSRPLAHSQNRTFPAAPCLHFLKASKPPKEPNGSLSCCCLGGC
jgi:hypothetical protein